jgi:hypothetical protein
MVISRHDDCALPWDTLFVARALGLTVRTTEHDAPVHLICASVDQSCP